MIEIDKILLSAERSIGNLPLCVNAAGRVHNVEVPSVIMTGHMPVRDRRFIYVKVFEICEGPPKNPLYL